MSSFSHELTPPSAGAGAVFLSCTNLETLEVIGPPERDPGLPVFGSTLALALDMRRAAGFAPGRTPA